MLQDIYKLGNMYFYKKYMKLNRKQHPLVDLFWECTLTCNAKCKHCGSNAENKTYQDDLTTQEIKDGFLQIAEDMKANEILVNVTGGEPLMRKDLCEVMQYATDLGFHWGMTTNGMLFNEETIAKLKEAKLETVSISIDGLEKTHDEFRGVPGSYRTIVDNISKLQKADFLNVIQVTTVFHKGNIDQLEAIYQEMKKLGIDSWRLVSIDPIGRAQEQEDILLDGADTKKILDFILQHKKGETMELIYGCPSFLGLEYEPEVRNGFFYCRAGINVASILHNGDLFVCPNVPRRKEWILGNIKQDRFSTVWNGKYDIYRKKDRTKDEDCNDCSYWDFCSGGAFHTFDFDAHKQNRCIYKLLNQNKGG